MKKRRARILVRMLAVMFAVLSIPYPTFASESLKDVNGDPVLTSKSYYMVAQTGPLKGQYVTFNGSYIYLTDSQAEARPIYFTHNFKKNDVSVDLGDDVYIDLDIEDSNRLFAHQGLTNNEFREDAFSKQLYTAKSYRLDRGSEGHAFKIYTHGGGYLGYRESDKLLRREIDEQWSLIPVAAAKRDVEWSNLLVNTATNEIKFPDGVESEGAELTPHIQVKGQDVDRSKVRWYLDKPIPGVMLDRKNGTMTVYSSAPKGSVIKVSAVYVEYGPINPIKVINTAEFKIT
ncbi:hypothetical protein [Paenibacillus sp. 481]|uniref:hypothetical protein n=1 Tax=Paenibacillus sp. 481 TaxID=2835869 RepID=UPI001E5FDBEB|nr:hypothetical protein [Paenibacillus sp. 481]UHA72141.1 hypothetical protein KIK04_15705 [Paenibacillus sp. 481]